MIKDSYEGNEKLRKAWEQRAVQSGNSQTGVLPLNFPDALNNYLHKQHIQIVLNKLLPQLPKGATLLDVGCGYGRISTCINDYRPDIRLIGVDFVLPYCRYYQRNTGNPSLCANFGSPPLLQASIDGLIAVTALMYIPAFEAVSVMKRLSDLLKANGIALFIDPGREFLKLVNRIKSSKVNSITSGRGFTVSEYEQLGRKASYQIVEEGGFPFFSAMLPVLWAFRKNQILIKHLLRHTEIIDQRFETYHKFSFHRWMFLKRASK